jgi:hypothetical protein
MAANFHLWHASALDGVPREHWKVTQQNAEEMMPVSTMENIMTKSTSCAPCTTRTKRVKHYYHLQWNFNLPVRPGRSHGGRYGRTCQLLTSFWTFTRFRRKVVGINSTGLFPELTLEELVFLHCKYYSIFLLQQEASALWNTVVINNNGILIHFS